ncbi:hypothetical protein PENSUB_8353 [Penicillium subrubescens]|uniref:Xylanolytic transcriptional activator regulatory domain-containing protein n=1 Tax=Penicillium subrubescens TaxID=1316194 RepID=A0A1Q5TGY9_9EURO|nr:hypothetical protein PENSUB_8353 [Penicillium subrubescens]
MAVFRNSQSGETSSNSNLPNTSNENTSSREVGSRSKPLLAGYFGPTSFVSPLTDDVDLVSAGQGLDVVEGTQRVLPPYWVQKISEILLTLGDFSAIESLLREYYDLSQSAAIPAPFILNSIGPFKAMCEQCPRVRNIEDLTSSITVRIIQNTAETFEVAPTMAGKDFHQLFTGPAIRLEMIGVICSIAGRARYLGLARDKFDGQSSPIQFARKMLAASDAAIYICKILTPLNDLTIWLVHENLLLSDSINGDSSPHCWSRLGDLSTDIFALGLHRDAKSSDQLPEFLLEARRRQFAAAYQLDKSIATFLGRPPRIPLRYSDCRMPLDISDDALAPEDTNLQYCPTDLDANNWNVHGVFQRSSWMRVRFIISMFRDEILEVSLQKILLYGFPSASLLIKALQHQKRTGEPFLYEGSRSALLRNLSVFISHLETIVRPDNSNYALFQRASQVFSKIIDEVLEPQDTIVDTEISDASLFDFDQMIPVDGLDLFNTMDFGVAFNQWLF